tara:strand:- start:16 stop:447 length:432 start_codon:yes stop_codon:yes gene_type:complete
MGKHTQTATAYRLSQAASDKAMMQMCKDMYGTGVVEKKDNQFYGRSIADLDMGIQKVSNWRKQIDGWWLNTPKQQQESKDMDYDVTIKRVDNGFIIKTHDGGGPLYGTTQVAADSGILAALIQKWGKAEETEDVKCKNCGCGK